MIEAIETQSKALQVPELVMPEPVQTIATYGLGIVAAILLLVAIRMSLRHKNWTLLVFYIAGTCASVWLLNRRGYAQSHQAQKNLGVEEQ